MSNVDPSWGPPTGAPVSHAGPTGLPPHQPHPVAYIFAVVMPLVLLAAFATPLAVVLIRRSGTESGPAVVPAANGSKGERGLGDPYYPEAGNSGYDVAKYQISVSWDPASATLTGTTTITARATQSLESFYFDLALPTTGVRVNGQPAAFDPQGFADVEVIPTATIAAGSDFSMVVDYAGNPGDIGGDVEPWLVTNAEWTALGEPESSAWWFPANDHPSDPALMDVSVRVPAGMEAISVGRLESADAAAEKDFDTWHWIARQPMATYLNFVSIGQFELKQGIEDGLPYVYAVSEQLRPADRQKVFAALLTSAGRLRVLESMFGPYPFTEIGGVVTAHHLPFGALENQTRPVYDAGAMLRGNGAPELLNHELAHMWFGDNVTLRQWNDVFNNEAYASWAQWAYNERTSNRKANDKLNEAYDSYANQPGFWNITMIDPSRPHLFDAVYVRGPMTLQALRNVIGDEAFFRFSRDWAQAPGSRSLEEWMAAAQAATTIDLDPFFQAWIYSPSVPARTPENGFR
ncbi:MAG TPA: M1 family metallopeptidase [Propionibacteriaceae bacterium]|nr:M1 family metallopeptidase [Propionibacteriaceae bacterium]